MLMTRDVLPMTLARAELRVTRPGTASQLEVSDRATSRLLRGLLTFNSPTNSPLLVVESVFRAGNDGHGLWNRERDDIVGNLIIPAIR
jgi:hypothetical protein